MLVSRWHGQCGLLLQLLCGGEDWPEGSRSWCDLLIPSHSPRQRLVQMPSLHPQLCCGEIRSHGSRHLLQQQRSHDDAQGSQPSMLEIRVVLQRLQLRQHLQH